MLRSSAGEVVAVAIQPPVDETALRITERADGAIAYLEVSGEIDIPGEHALRRSVDRALAGGARCVIFDLRNVSYMDTGALNVLLGAKSELVAWGGEVYVLVEEDMPRRVIYMARLQGAMKVCDSVDEAFADIARRATQVGGNVAA